jgi:hypothetical protein
MESLAALMSTNHRARPMKILMNPMERRLSGRQGRGMSKVHNARDAMGVDFISQASLVPCSKFNFSRLVELLCYEGDLLV